jgi:MoxR-vWA-beta-propeller ternary system domain bpX5
VIGAAFEWQWRRSPEPPAPRAVVAWSEAAPRLHARLQALAPARAARLHVTAAASVLVVCAHDHDDLPWVDGAGYAAACAHAPNLWLPTLWEPDAPVDLLGRALVARHARQPLLLWREPAAIVPLDRLMPLSPAVLQRVSELWQGQRDRSGALRT